MPVDEAKKLGDYIKVTGPADLKATPATFSFVRERRIPIDWEALFKATGERFVDQVNRRANRLETYVMGSRERDKRNYQAGFEDGWLVPLTQQDPAYVHDPATVTRSSVDPAASVASALPNVVAPGTRIVPTADSKAVEDGLIVRVESRKPKGNRWYRLLDEKGDAISSARFKSEWEAAWSAVGALELVQYRSSETAVAPQELARTRFTFTEVIRADASVIRGAFEALKIERELSNAHAERAKALTGLVAGSPREDLADLGSQYRELMAYVRDVSNKIRRLEDSARGLGYVLITNSETKVNYFGEDGSSKPESLTEGALYLINPRTVTWTTQHKEQNGRSFWGKRRYSWRTERHSRTFPYYEMVEPDNDPWIEATESYAKAGFTTYLFDVATDGRLTCDDLSLSDLVERLDDDEEFRLRTIVGLPIREKSILGDEFLVGYLMIGRPLPDVMRTRLPEIVAYEQMSYRFAWTGTSLGELVTTIPLSPGEEREVTVQVSSSLEERTNQMSSSLVDITRIDKQDFESSFEKEVRKETDTKQSFEAEAKGSYGAASGSAKFSNEKSTKDVVRTLNRAVQRTSQSLSRQDRVETRVERSDVRKSELSNRMVYKVRNINEAVTLNVCLYRLMNTYDAVARLEKVTYAIETGRSMLAGADIYQHDRFELRKASDVVDMMTDQQNFPIDLSDLTDMEGFMLRSALQAQITARNEESVESSLLDENLAGFDTLKQSMATNFADGAPKMASELLEQITKDFASLPKTGHEFAASSNERVEALNAMSLKIVDHAERNLNDRSFDEVQESFLVDSGGVYADVIMGQKAGADQYALDRRDLEKKRIESEIALNEARRQWLLSRVKPVG